MKNRILRSALSVALCAAMLLSQGLTAFADGEIVSRALETSPEYIQETETRIPNGECNAPSKPTIEDLDRLFTNNTKVNISCKKNKHADKWYPVKDNSVDRLGYLFIGPVEVDDNNHYTAKISLNDAFFINLYNQEEGGDHSLVSKTYITLSYDGEKWVFNDESKLDFDVVVTCPDNDNPGGGEDPGTNPGGVPSITRDEIVKVLGNATVNVVCTIDGNHIPFKITADSIRVGEWDKNDNSVPFYLLTKSYVDEFNSTYPGHTLKNSNDKEIEFWIFYGEDGWTVNFTSLDVEVVCSGTPVEPTDTPEPPSMEKVMELLWDKKVTANCINDDYKKKETYDIQYETIGGLLNPTIKPIEGENGSYSLKLTIAYDPYKDDFEDKYGPHDFADNQTSTSEFYLKWDGLKWSLKDPDSFPGSFNVICDTPSTESLWGWNNGKEVIITCVEENALHTKGMTLSLVGVNGDKYWKFDPITWDQEQKCYTTTVTLEPDKYLEVYSGQYGEHALVSDHEDTVLSLKLSYQDGNQDGNGKWISNGDKFYLFVECNAPSKPTIEDLDRLFTNNTKVNISCKKNKHADKWYPVKDNSVDRLGYLFIGPVEVDDNNHYTAKISLNDAFFINLYNQEEGGDHSLVSKTYITLSYDGEKWVFNDESKLDFDVVVTCPDNDNPGGGEDPGTNPGGGDNGNNGGNNNGGSTGGGSSVSRRDDDDDWEPLPNNNYRVTKKNDKPSQNTQIVVRDPADNSDNTSSNTGSDSGKHNPETGDTTTVFAAMALAAVSLGGAVLLGRKKK